MSKYNLGDILLFKGNGWFSSIIMAHPKAEYSHVALVYEDRGNKFVFESTSLGTLHDVRTCAPICGVQVVPLEERIATYDGEVFHRPIIGKRSQVNKTMFDLFIDLHHGKPYESSNWELANAQLDVFPWNANKADDSTLFCSETAIMALKEAEFIGDWGTLPPNEFTPTDLARPLPLRAGFNDGPIEQIK